MDKMEFKEYLELKRKQRALVESIRDLKGKLAAFDYQETAEVVTRGRKRRRVLGRVVVRGYDHKKYTDIKNKLLRKQLEAAQFESDEFAALEWDAVDFMTDGLPFDEHEIRLILLHLVPYPGELIKSWDEVAREMNKKHGMRVKADALRMKLSRFLEA